MQKFYSHMENYAQDMFIKKYFITYSICSLIKKKVLSSVCLEGRDKGDEDLREIKQSRPLKYSIFTSEERKGIPSKWSFGILETGEEWK